MALRPAPITQQSYSYAVGNTPAVNLTDNVPPDVDAKALPLGCGDIRNILCTVYNGAGPKNRTLDFTCCDIEAEIIARNIVALTFVDPDKEGAHNQHLWNFFYHVFIDLESMTALQAHVEKLLESAQSIEAWNSSEYSSLIRFCDDSTFTAVVRLWKLYAIEVSTGPAYTNIQTLFKDQWKAFQQHQRDRTRDGVVLDGLRATAPMLFESYIDVSPLAEFQLAPAYIQLANTSPLTGKTAQNMWPTATNMLRVAFEQFNAWCNALRERAGFLTIRYVHADASALCHTLQHIKKHRKVDDAYWYRDPWSFERLALNKIDYSAQGSAPTSFNIIDTSNLMDHLGSLNVLVAAAPLLERASTSTLRTEMMLPREANVSDSAEKPLCGNLPTVALLLGLKPIQYWTNAPAAWTPNKTLLKDFPDRDPIFSTLSRPIILWKPVDLSYVHYDASELARFVYGVYSEMHADEGFSAQI